MKGILIGENLQGIVRGHCSFRYHLMVTSVSSSSSCFSSSSSSSVPLRSPQRHILQSAEPEAPHVPPLDNARHAPCIARSLLFIEKTFALFLHIHGPTHDLTQHHRHHQHVTPGTRFLNQQVKTNVLAKVYSFTL